MDSSVYCLPADLLGEGADRVAGPVRDRAGVSGVTVAACYHASRDILPHNPAYRVASLAAGAFYTVDPSVYPAARGHHHERCLEDYGDITRFLPGLCFCLACAPARPPVTTWTSPPWPPGAERTWPACSIRPPAPPPLPPPPPPPPPLRPRPRPRPRSAPAPAPAPPAHH